MLNDSPLVTLYKTEYYNDYYTMIKNGLPVTDYTVRLILGFPEVTRKKFLGIF